jgi:aconitate hydratase
MVRGTFANVRLRNALAEKEGGWTSHLPDGEEMTIFAASERYLAEQTPLIVLAGKEYGSGSSRDWAAKGPRLLGVRAVIAESFERIHRSNLLMMGIVPLRFQGGESREALGLSGRERYSISGLAGGGSDRATVTAVPDGGGEPITFEVSVCLDTPREREYVEHGGILPYVIRVRLG